MFLYNFLIIIFFRLVPVLPSKGLFSSFGAWPGWRRIGWIEKYVATNLNYRRKNFNWTFQNYEEIMTCSVTKSFQWHSPKSFSSSSISLHPLKGFRLSFQRKGQMWKNLLSLSRSLSLEDVRHKLSLSTRFEKNGMKWQKLQLFLFFINNGQL